jgi:hypothetical protein
MVVYLVSGCLIGILMSGVFRSYVFMYEVRVNIPVIGCYTWECVMFSFNSSVDSLDLVLALYELNKVTC